MKWFTSILASLLLLISFMPCADREAGACKEKAEWVSSHDHANESGDDNCSPFCYCTCCAGYSIEHFTTDFPSIHVVARAYHSSFLTASVTEISLPVWQPPQLMG